MDYETNNIDKNFITVNISTPSAVQVKTMHRYIDLRRIMSATSIVKLIERCELDSHADTCVAGANTLILETTGQKLYVYGFHKVLGPMPNIDIGKDATIWDCPTTGIPYMVIISEALFFGDKIAATLLTHNQLCANRIKVDHVPKQCEPKSCHSIHSFPKADEDI